MASCNYQSSRAREEKEGRRKEGKPRTWMIRVAPRALGGQIVADARLSWRARAARHRVVLFYGRNSSRRAGSAYRDRRDSLSSFSCPDLPQHFKSLLSRSRASCGRPATHARTHTRSRSRATRSSRSCLDSVDSIVRRFSRAALTLVVRNLRSGTGAGVIGNPARSGAGSIFESMKLCRNPAAMHVRRLPTP